MVRQIELLGPRGARWRCEVPTSRRERTRGVLGRPLGSGTALRLERCTSVHTVGMGEPITVARLSETFEVRDVRVMAPNRFLLPAWKRGHVLECTVGADVRPGDVLVPG